MEAMFVFMMLLCLILSIHVQGDDSKECVRKIDRIQKGRSCRKRCDHMGRCASPRKECLCDGLCGMSCINKNLKCNAIPRRIKNGKADIMPFNKYGAIARYECDDGYQLEGVSARVCQGDGTWSDEQPKCIVTRDEIEQKTECNEPPQVHHGKHDGEPWRSTFKLGVMLRYECEAGFTVSKGSIVKAWCVGEGLWVGPNMTCSHAGCPLNTTTFQNGWISRPEDMSTGAILRYHCKDGYFLAGRAERTCQPNGHWGGKEPSCEKVTCGPPPTIEHSIIMDIENRDSYAEDGTFSSGQQITYDCEKGYEIQGDPRAMCNDDGNWIGLNSVKCIAISCGFPQNIENGWRAGYLFSYGNSVKYSCNNGYEMIGVDQLTCMEDQKWSGVPPRCIAVECPLIRTPLNGRMVGSGNAFGTVLRFECNEGFMLTGSVERRCESTRSWSGEPVLCTKIKCPWPGPIWNGYMLGEETTVGSDIYFSCNVRTNFDGSSMSTKCLENGQWSYPPPTCWGQCQIPMIDNVDKISGTNQPGDWLRHREVVTYSCRNGLVPDVSDRVECHNGTWSSIPKCVPSPCPTSPPHVESGLRIFDGKKHGSRARYICRNGYRLTGMDNPDSAFLDCHFGSWIGGDPKCEEFYCKNPGTIKNGKVYKKGFKARFSFQLYITTIRHGDRLQYTCNKGYERKGPSGATCVNGQWRPDLNNPGTKCVKARHAPFPKLWLPAEEQGEQS